MEFASERDSVEDEEAQGTESSEEPGLMEQQASKAAGAENSFFEDWGAPY